MDAIQSLSTRPIAVKMPVTKKWPNRCILAQNEELRQVTFLEKKMGTRSILKKTPRL